MNKKVAFHFKLRADWLDETRSECFIEGDDLDTRPITELADIYSYYFNYKASQWYE